MKIKYIISLSMVALIGASCWGAAENDKQRATGIKDERPAEPVAQQEAPGAFWEMPREIFDEHILKHMPAAKLMEMAFEHPGLYKRIKTIPQFIQLQQNMNSQMIMYANNKQEVFLDAAQWDYPGAIDVIDYLAPDVNIDAYNASGYTALMLAASHNNLEMAKLLLANRANINDNSANGNTTLILAVFKNNLEMAKLLLANGADINANNTRGDTALMLAAYKNNLEMAKLLLANGADINANNTRGDTALILAASNNSPKLAELLLAKGANINMHNLFGYTALMMAASNNSPKLAELLLAKGADINARNRDGNTALNLAERNLTSLINDPDYKKRARTLQNLLTRKRLNP